MGLGLGGQAVALATPKLDLAPCRVDGLEREAKCGWIARPLNTQTHPATKDAEIRIRVLVIPAQARHAKPDPVFFLAGGPGQSATELASLLSGRFARLLNRRDLVLVDQRGTGQSAPLHCPATPPTRPLSEAVDPNRQSADLLACLKAAQSLPYGDLTAFDTTRAMQDLDAVRAALGAQQINLIGGSYGTRAGLEYLRLFPERVRRLVLDGVAPPDAALPISMGLDARAALLQHIERCEASSECKTQFPNLRQQWSHLVQQKRIQVRGLHPITGQPEQFSIPGYAMWELGRMALYAPEVAAVLPHSISQASVGNWAPFLGMLSLMNGHPRRPMAGALHFSVICAEDFPVMTGQVQGVSVPAIPADAQAAVQASAEVYRLACPHWPKAKVDRAFYSIRTAPAPVAILSGGSDPVTPPHHGDRVARLLGSKAIHAVVPNAGHGVMGLSCVRDALFEFINATSEEEALKAPIHCARDIPAPSPFQPLGHRP